MPVVLVYEAATCTIRPFSRAHFRRAIGRCFATYVEIMAYCFRPCDLIVSGDLPTDTSKPMFIIANHQVDADWWYISELMRVHGGAGNLKIAMKHTLRSLPILGTGMAMLDFLFLRRDIKVDRVAIQAYMQNFVQDNFPFWLLLFPEGTTIFIESMAKSHEFGQKQNRPMLHRVLLPRSTGLRLMLEAFKDSPVKPDILDITMAFPSYSGEVPTFAMGYDRHVDVQLPSMKKIVMGQGPSKVHLHCRRIPMADVGENVEGCLDQLWVAKEALLNEFIEHQCFASQKDQTQVLRPQASWRAVGHLWLVGGMCLCFWPILLACYFVGVVVRAVFGGIKIVPKSLSLQ
ncbi:hypothetical protein, variant [Aphanomyces invadans]|uniref:Phospholipid/glycerol acyltransferase domain-containing protein n=1 Tax=Aphanomyces invadans TaxID=157072 RepID=A0A024U4H8_9STRA|nr:hypothetical protein, variant [Aphanomyces invadans]ETW00792.1 hypothetical protein, variant [Aphanomyces invadans]|eukprot:XP_008870927.1 hypothetical protein, variant [Aphanomyces invadans]